MVVNILLASTAYEQWQREKISTIAASAEKSLCIGRHMLPDCVITFVYSMALRQLLRRPLLATTFMRAGHGWERPDVPLSKPYVHRRRVLSISIAAQNWGSELPVVRWCSAGVLSQRQLTLPIQQQWCQQVHESVSTAFWSISWARSASRHLCQLQGNEPVLLQHYTPVPWEANEKRIEESEKATKSRRMHKFFANNPFGLGTVKLTQRWLPIRPCSLCRMETQAPSKPRAYISSKKWTRKAECSSSANSQKPLNSSKRRIAHTHIIIDNTPWINPSLHRVLSQQALSDIVYTEQYWQVRRSWVQSRAYQTIHWMNRRVHIAEQQFCGAVVGVDGE